MKFIDFLKMHRITIMKVLLDILAKPLMRFIKKSVKIEYVYTFEVFNAEKQLVYISPVYFLTPDRAKLSGDIVCEWYGVDGMYCTVRKVHVDSELFEQLKLPGDERVFEDKKETNAD